MNEEVEVPIVLKTTVMIRPNCSSCDHLTQKFKKQKLIDSLFSRDKEFDCNFCNKLQKPICEVDDIESCTPICNLELFEASEWEEIEVHIKWDQQTKRFIEKER